MTQPITKADVLECLNRHIQNCSEADAGDAEAARDAIILDELRGLMQQAPDKMIETLFRLRSAIKMGDTDLLSLLADLPVD